MRFLRKGSDEDEEEDETGDSVKEQKKRIRALKLERERLQLEKEVSEIKPGAKEEELKLTSQDAIEIAKLPPDQRQNAIEVYAAIRSADRSGSSGLLPYLIAFGRQNPTASQSDMADFAKSMIETLKTGIDLGRGGGQQSGQKSAGEMLQEAIMTIKPFYDKLSESEKSVFDERLKRVEDKVTDPIEAMTNIFKVAEQFGYTRGGSNPELEKMRLDYEDRWKTEDRRHTLEVQRTDGLIRVLEKIAENLNISDGIARGIAGGLMGLKAQPQPRPEAPAPPSPQGPMAKCSGCGHVFKLTPEMEDIVPCPSCGVKLDIGALRKGGASQH